MINETDIEAFKDTVKDPPERRDCKNCKHFLPEKNLLNLWGLIKDYSYYNFAQCEITVYGEALYCSIHRQNRFKDYRLCGPKGKYWKKNEAPY